MVHKGIDSRFIWLRYVDFYRGNLCAIYSVSYNQ